MTIIREKINVKLVGLVCLSVRDEIISNFIPVFNIVYYLKNGVI